MKLPKLNGKEVLNLSIRPSFEPWVNWSVVLTPEGTTCMRRTMFRHQALKQYPEVRQAMRSGDLAGLKPPEGLFAWRDAELDAAQFRALIAEGHALRLPLIIPPSDYAGLDGVSYSLKTGDLFSGEVCLQWWSDWPAEWQPLFDWVSKLEAWLDGHVAG